MSKKKRKHHGTQKKPVLDCAFYATPAGEQPVRSWLRDFKKDGDEETADVVGSDIETVQWRWPLGMPLVEKFGGKLFAVRSSSPSGEWRVFFTVTERMMVLLHGVGKKSKKALPREIELARERLKEVMSQ